MTLVLSRLDLAVRHWSGIPIKQQMFLGLAQPLGYKCQGGSPGFIPRLAGALGSLVSSPET